MLLEELSCTVGEQGGRKIKQALMIVHNFARAVSDSADFVAEVRAEPSYRGSSDGSDGSAAAWSALCDSASTRDALLRAAASQIERLNRESAQEVGRALREQGLRLHGMDSSP